MKACNAKRHIFKMKLILEVLLIVIPVVAFTFTPSDDDRIVGGNATDISRFKFAVCLFILKSYDELIHFDKPICGGSIIRQYWVLTAAHCIRDPRLFDIDKAIRKSALVVRGNTSYCETGENRIDHVVTVYRSHERNKMYGPDYDIALLKVRKPFTGVNENIIKLAPLNYKLIADETVLVIGWGTTEDITSTTNRLRYVDLKIFSLKECKKIWNSAATPYKVTPQNICAGWRRGGKDSCSRDSGGPLIDKNTLQIGIVSWGARECGNGFPGVYVSVPVFVKWINEEIQKVRRSKQ